MSAPFHQELGRSGLLECSMGCLNLGGVRGMDGTKALARSGYVVWPAAIHTQFLGLDHGGVSLIDCRPSDS
jgi:hypothetical protein